MLLDQAACEQIHEAGLKVLERVGVRVDDPEVVAKLQEAGGQVSPGNVVKIPRKLVEWALQQAPKKIRVADRTGKVWEMGPQGGTMVLTGNALYINRGKERHDLTAADLAELARVVDACKNLGGMVGTGISDYPPPTRDFVGFRIMARNTAKHLRPCIYSDKGGRLVMEMAQVLLGGTPLRERPIVSTGFSILSPLHWTAFALGVFKQTAGFGVPATINSEPLGGGTAPVTLAGCLTIGDADVLSGLVINQLLEPGRPCIYNIGFAHVLDMANTIALTGAPENALLQAAGADMARFHGLPCAAWMSTESPVADAQSAMEKTMTGLAHAAAGVNLIWGAGNLEGTLAMSPEALVADDEIAGYFLRYRQGIPLDAEEMALDEIRAAAKSGDFLNSPHTLKHFRRVLSRARIAARMRHGDWEAQGSPTFEESAERRVRQILAAEPQHYLDAQQKAELERIERAAAGN